eukprot:SAG31_NODE_9675_length_1243_cov_1.272727_1_plen_137_part_00
MKLPPKDNITSVQLGPDGKDILLGTASGAIVCIDAFDGHRKAAMRPPPPIPGIDKSAAAPATRCKPVFTPDAKYVLAGSIGGHVHGWDTQTGQLLATLPGHPSATSAVLFNPTKLMMVSGCQAGALAFWLPAPLGS